MLIFFMALCNIFFFLSCLASLDHCFWISDAYYHNSVSLIRGGGGGGAVGVGITLQET